MSTVQANKTVGHASGCCRLTFWGQNLTTNIIGLYSLIIGIPQEGVSYDDGNILGRGVETENVFNCKGVLATKQSGNQTVNEKTFSIAYNDDYNFVVNNINPTINRSTMKAILDGTKFKLSSGQEVAVLGMQGFRWLGTDDFETLNTFYAFEQDGKLISPDKLDANGDPVLVTNSVKSPYEKSALIMAEFLYKYNSALIKGDRFVYCMPMTSTFSEGSGTSPNSYSIDMERFSDARSIKEYIVEGTGRDSFLTTLTGTVSATTTTVTGVGTAFTTELSAGDTIVIGGVVKVVDAIATDTSLTVTVAYATPITSTTGYLEKEEDIYYLTADHLYYVAAPGTPTTTPADGTVAVVVDSDTGLLNEVWIYTGGAWVESTEATYKKGCKFVCKGISTDLAVLPTSTSGYNLVVAKIDGISGVFSAYGSVFTANVDATPFYFPILDWDYSSANFISFIGE